MGVRVYRRDRAGGSEAFAPDPADPFIDTIAKRKDTHISHSVTHGNLLRHVSARVVGGLVVDPRFFSCLFEADLRGVETELGCRASSRQSCEGLAGFGLSFPFRGRVARA